MKTDKADILTLLRNSEDYVSGQQLCDRFGVTRTAVWKVINQLKEEGYQIESVSRRGYRLVEGPADILSESEIASILKTQWAGRKLYCFDTTGSTNTDAKRLGEEGEPHGTVVTADLQTAGRGRMDRSFQSPRGKGVYLTALLRPNLPPERLLPVTAMAGVAVCGAVEELCGVRPGLKWPNDPVLGGKKLCGILTELSLEGETGRVQYLVLGIGVNVGQRLEDFSPEVAEMATSLSIALGRPVSRPALAAAEIRALDRLYADLLAGNLAPYLAAYRRDCVNLGKSVQLISPDGSRETAQALDVDNDFSLVVRTAAGEIRTVRSGEVSVRGMYGYIE